MLVVCPGCRSRYQVNADAWPTMADDGGLPVPRPRKVRCRACGETWMAVPEEDILELGDPLPPDPPVRAAPPPLPPSLRAETLAAAPPLPPDPLPRVAISPSVSGLRATLRHVEEDEEEEEHPRRRIWPWLLGLLLTLLLLAAVGGGLLWTGVVRTEQLGLPAVELPPIELPQWADPAGLNLSLPNVRVPSTPPPPLTLEIAAERRQIDGGRLLWDVRGTLTNPTDRTLEVPVVELLLLDAGGKSVASWSVRPEAGRLAPGAATRFESSAIDPPASAVRVRAALKPAGLGRM